MTSFYKFHVSYLNPDGEAVNQTTRYMKDVACDTCEADLNCFSGCGAALDHVFDEWQSRYMRLSTRPIDDPTRKDTPTPEPIRFRDIFDNMGAEDPLNPGFRWHIQQIEHIDFF